MSEEFRLPHGTAPTPAPETDRVDNPADLVPARTYLNALVGGVVLVLGAVLLLFKSFQPLPQFESLTVFEATVDDVDTVRSSMQGLADLFRDPIERYDVRFVNRSARYRYAAVNPKSTVVAQLRPNDLVKVWSDVGKTYTIFQLERAGQMLISFDEELERRRRSRRLDLFLSLPIILACAVASFWFVGRLHYQFGTRSPKN